MPHFGVRLPNPAIWAAEAAKSYARANRFDKSVEILKSALVASPNLHYLLGLLYYYLDTSGNTAALSALSGKLEQQSQIIAWIFGKYLVAQRRQDQQGLCGMLKNSAAPQICFFNAHPRYSGSYY